MTKNETAFLKTIGFSEIGRDLLAHSDDGYNVLLGGTLFASYADHPRKNITINGLTSTAAGKYQILERYYDYYRAELNLPDFSPHSQDLIALQLIKECHASDDVKEGNFEKAILKCNSRWASLPESHYGQHTNTMNYLKAYYENVGGLLA
jgi:muramidase (phage lysozyme)